MSYGKDPDWMTRGVGAIAAADVAGGRRARAQRARARVMAVIDRRRAALAHGKGRKLPVPLGAVPQPMSQPQIAKGGYLEVPVLSSGKYGPKGLPTGGGGLPAKPRPGGWIDNLKSFLSPPGPVPQAPGTSPQPGGGGTGFTTFPGNKFPTPGGGLGGKPGPGGKGLPGPSGKTGDTTTTGTTTGTTTTTTLPDYTCWDGRTLPGSGPPPDTEWCPPQQMIDDGHMLPPQPSTQSPSLLEVGVGIGILWLLLRDKD